MALTLPGYEVSHYAEDGIDGVLRLSVVPTQIVELCPDCGRPCDSWHQKRWLENILDFPLGGRPVCLKVRVFQYQCEHCGRTWTPHSPVVAEGTWETARLVARAGAEPYAAGNVLREYVETGSEPAFRAQPCDSSSRCRMSSSSAWSPTRASS